MSCLETLLPVSLLLVDVGVELLLNPKMSSSSSSSSGKGEALTSFFDLGLAFWKRSSVSSSKMDGSVLLSFFELKSLATCGCEVLAVCLVEEALEAEVAPNRLSVAKMSYSSEGGSTLLLLLSLLESFFTAFLDSGSVSTRGLGTASGREAVGGEAAGKAEEAAEEAAEVSGVGLTVAWLFLCGKGKTKPVRLELDLKTSLLLLCSSSATDLWAACCLAALDWGLRCAATLARVCTTEELHSSQKWSWKESPDNKHESGTKS